MFELYRRCFRRSQLLYDIEDDLNVGVKSLAIRLGHNAKPYFVLFQMGMLGCLLAVGVNSDAGLVYYFGTLLTMAHLAGLLRRW
ncbi:hypothetical protein X801_09889 [Opisthorchis viverrini]|uniref:Uncharacterized protein n=1 Tax=Opisthorchis viverrini TaxID=6198 RepID=A0A1S8WIP1_OPIVI|nr:hypothetical protein X801_09889 [Opisthorchis viverrini]